MNLQDINTLKIWLYAWNDEIAKLNKGIKKTKEAYLQPLNLNSQENNIGYR